MRLALLPLVLVFALAACSKLNMENYQRLKVGQSYDEIVAIVGQPAHCDEMLGIRQCQWGGDARHIRVGFVAGTALTLSAHNLQ